MEGWVACLCCCQVNERNFGQRSYRLAQFDFRQRGIAEQGSWNSLRCHHRGDAHKRFGLRAWCHTARRIAHNDALHGELEGAVNAFGIRQRTTRPRLPPHQVHYILKIIIKADLTLVMSVAK